MRNRLCNYVLREDYLCIIYKTFTQASVGSVSQRRTDHGSLSGCGSQGSAATDTIAEPAVSATVGTTDNTAFPLPEGPEESTILSSRSTAFPMTFTVVWTLPPCWLWRTAA